MFAFWNHRILDPAHLTRASALDRMMPTLSPKISLLIPGTCENMACTAMLEKEHNGVKVAGDTQGGRQIWFEDMCVVCLGHCQGPCVHPWSTCCCLKRACPLSKNLIWQIKEKLSDFLIF